ncbi:MAG: amidohydrolase family protein, partial [Roseobacter sp.]
MTDTNKIFVNLNLATMDDPAIAYGWIENGAIVVNDCTIEWIGPRVALPAVYDSLTQIDLKGRVVTPGLIDCHTHIVHGGDRAIEFEMRLNGASYEEVAR